MKTLICAAVLAATSGIAHATTITEIDDFAGATISPPMSAPGAIYDFSGIGAYSVSGSLNWLCAGECDQNDPADIFAFNMGPNRAVEDITLTMTNLTASGGGAQFSDGSVSGTFGLTVGDVTLTSPGAVGFATTSFSGAFSDAVNVVTSYPEGLVHVLGVGIAPGGLLTLFSDAQVTADWQISFNVVDTSSGPGPAPVPLPATGILLVAGLGGLAAWRRRAT
ncbi:VPLPA-CTERM sorting domain-containing protein [Gymnodinialimonas sp. 2305UL16-5]|uniref:VPLPA-CTERM sorting domain-containing protein n=1 Tax=Gymnodinialimonas mytili TaxID=3126503 RepID=UPI0030A52325